MYRDDLLEYRRSVYQVAESVVLTDPGYLLVIFSGFNIQPQGEKVELHDYVHFARVTPCVTLQTNPSHQTHNCHAN